MKKYFLIFAVASAIVSPLLPAQIQPGRAVQISIMGVPAEEKSRISTTYPVSESGTITMPFIGTVRVSGMLAEDVSRTLAQRYKAAEIYTDPVFHVIDSNAKSIEQQVVYVGGDVGRTGPVPYNRTLTLYQAIQTAGGETEFGAINRVVVYRNGKTVKFDVRKAEGMNVILKPNDTIDVPRKNWIGL